VTARELARLHRLMRPGEKLAGLVVARVGGRRTWRLVMVRDGARRVVAGGDERDEGQSDVRRRGRREPGT